MVSIPDWAKFSQMAIGQKTNSMAMLNKYFKQQEQVAIKQAEETGYFLTPDHQYLLQHMGPRNGGNKTNLARIFFICLPSLHIRKLGDIPLCSSLQICILPNNFLTKIDSLYSCQQIVKLDLHGNQLTRVPGSSFWSSLRKLRALNLHDNPLGKFETLQSLAAAPALAIVTLFDTPLYLKTNYRHHVVNSIWTLKALDHHVVSDEEIIEDALFEGHFCALSPFLKIDLCPMSPPDANYWQHVNLFKKLEAQINKILAKHSPVIIVQRYTRGYLTRKALGLVQPRKRTAQPKDVLIPAVVSEEQIVSMKSSRSLSGQKEDYQAGNVPPPTPTAFGALFIEKGSVAPGHQQNICINLAKLQTGTMQSLLENADKLELTYQTLIRYPTMDKKQKKLKHKKGEKPQRIKSIRQFFGPVVKTPPDEAQQEDDDEDQQLTNYRLCGRQPTLILSEPTSDMVLTRMDAGHQVRMAEAERVHKARLELPPKILPFNFNTKRQHFFTRVHGTMGLSCLMAVQKAYKDREKAEEATAKMEYIMAMREMRQRAKERIQVYHDEKHNQVMRQRDHDRAKMLEQLEKKELLRLSYLNKKQAIKGRASQLSKTLHADSTFMTEFNTHHTSVSKALMRHDRQTQYEENLSAKKDKVSGLRTVEVEQQNTVKKYLQHRQLMRQSESSIVRAALDTCVLQETADRMMAVHQHVARAKALEESVHVLFPLATTSIVIGSTSGGLIHLEKKPSKEEGLPHHIT